MQANNARNPAHPFALVDGVALSASRQRLDRLLARQLGDVLEAVYVPRGPRDGARQCAANLFLYASREHLPRAVGDAAAELLPGHL